MKSAASQKAEIAVLIPCFNNMEGLRKSLESIKYHSGRLLVVIADDGSEIPVTKTGIGGLMDPPQQLIILRSEENHGITYALNSGLEYIAKEINPAYVARLDCGDSCSADRFFQQHAYLENNPSIVFVGSWCLFKEEGRSSYRYTTPIGRRAIARGMNFRNLFIHPSVMWRWQGNEELRYPKEFPHAEDYGFFYQLLHRGDAAIINRYLVTCEINANGISMKNRLQQMKSRKKVIREYSRPGAARILGLAKLNLMMLIPGKWALTTKKFLYR